MLAHHRDLVEPRDAGGRIDRQRSTMGVPQVVIVGRPNVGKSSMFNWLAGTKIALVSVGANRMRQPVTRWFLASAAKLGT